MRSLHLLRCEDCVPLLFGILLTQTESLNDSTIALDVAVFEIVEQGAALTDEDGQRTCGVMILVVALQVLGQMLDAIGEQCNLAFR